MNAKARSDTFEHLIGSVVLVPVQRNDRKRGPHNDAKCVFTVVGCGVSHGRAWVRCEPVNGKGSLCSSTFELILPLAPPVPPP